jgi:hypothetical protein
MESVVHALGVVLLFGACLIAIISLVLGFPGTFVILGAAVVYAWATDFAAVRWSTIGWLTILAVAGEAIEFLASGVGAAAADVGPPSRRVWISALTGGFIGGLVGTPFLFGVGALLGALAGAFAGAAFAVASQGGTLRSALETGMAALRGRLLGFVVKAALAVVMVLVLAAAIVRASVRDSCVDALRRLDYECDRAGVSSHARCCKHLPPILPV